jgi:hypothetical protein
MFGLKNVPDEVFDIMLPVKPRKEGIIYDTEINYIDIILNNCYDKKRGQNNERYYSISF